MEDSTLTYEDGMPFPNENLVVTIYWDADTTDYTYVVEYVNIRLAGSAPSLAEVFEKAHEEAFGITEKWEVAKAQAAKLLAELKEREAGKNVVSFPGGESVG